MLFIVSWGVLSLFAQWLFAQWLLPLRACAQWYIVVF